MKQSQYRVTPNTHKLCTNCGELVRNITPEPCPSCGEESGDNLFTNAWCPDCDEHLEHLNCVEVYEEHLYSDFRMNKSGFTYNDNYYTEDRGDDIPDSWRYSCPYCHTDFTTDTDNAEMILNGDWSWHNW